VPSLLSFTFSKENPLPDEILNFRRYKFIRATGLITICFDSHSAFDNKHEERKRKKKRERKRDDGRVSISDKLIGLKPGASR